MPLDVASGKPIPKPHDYDLWLECRNCGSLYQKYETKVEPEIEPIKQPMNGPKERFRGWRRNLSSALVEDRILD